MILQGTRIKNVPCEASSCQCPELIVEIGRQPFLWKARKPNDAAQQWTAELFH